MYAKTSDFLSLRNEKFSSSNTTFKCEDSVNCCDTRMDQLAIQLFQQAWIRTYREPLLKQAAAFENASAYFYNFFSKCLDTFWYELDSNFNKTYQEFYIRRRHVFVTFHTSLQRYLESSVEDESYQLNSKREKRKHEKLSDVLKSVFGLLLYNIMEAVDRKDFSASPENSTSSEMSRCMVTALTEKPEIFKPIKDSWDLIDTHVNRAIPVVRVFVNSLAVVREEIELIVNQQDPSIFLPCMQRVLQFTHCYRCQQQSDATIPPCQTICRQSINEACIGTQWQTVFKALLQHLQNANSYLKQPFNFVNIIHNLPNEISSLIMNIQTTIIQHWIELQEKCKMPARPRRRRWSSLSNDPFILKEQEQLQEDYYRNMRRIQMANEASKFISPMENPRNLVNQPPLSQQQQQQPSPFSTSPAMLERALDLQMDMMQKVLKMFEEFSEVVCRQFSEVPNEGPANLGYYPEAQQCWNGRVVMSSKFDDATFTPQAITHPDMNVNSQHRLQILGESLQQAISRSNMNNEPSVILLRRPLPLKNYILPFAGIPPSSKHYPFDGPIEVVNRKPLKDSEEGSGFVPPKIPLEENQTRDRQFGGKVTGRQVTKKATSRIYATTTPRASQRVMEDDEDKLNRNIAAQLPLTTSKQDALSHSSPPSIYSTTSSSLSPTSTPIPIVSTTSLSSRLSTSIHITFSLFLCLLCPFILNQSFLLF